MISIAVSGVAIALLALTMRQVREEYRMYILLAAGILFSWKIVEQLEVFTAWLAQFQEYIPIETSYLESILKMMGVTYLAEFAGSICRDSGQELLSEQIGMAARLTILGMSLPIVLSILRLVQGLI